MNNERVELRKIQTGIEGFDHICEGGIPEGRTTLVAGTPGSAKTVLASQFLLEGITKYDHPGVFVTFEESTEDIIRNMRSFGWDIERWKDEGKWVFVDASPEPRGETVIAGSYDLAALMARIEHAVVKSRAKRVVLDSLGAVFSQYSDATRMRGELFKIAYVLREMGVTSIMTCERNEEYGDISRFGIEGFVADNVVILRNILENEKRRRTAEVLKFRGAQHRKGEYPFTIVPNQGIVVIPLSGIELKQKSSDVRVTSGNVVLDEMCGGGFFRDSIVLVSGATGNGKTLMATEFLAGSIEKDEVGLFFAFEESREQLFRNASGWGIDFEQMERDGQLVVVCNYPESASLEDHLISMKETIDRVKPDRIAVDSLSALERVGSLKGFREFVIGLTSFIKMRETIGFFTATTSSLMGGTSITEGHFSTITDSIILLRYVELFGEMRRGMTVLKMRGSLHDKNIREFYIDNAGLHIGKAFRNVMGIFAGNASHVVQDELDKIEEAFRTD